MLHLAPLYVLCFLVSSLPPPFISFQGTVHVTDARISRQFSDKHYSSRRLRHGGINITPGVEETHYLIQKDLALPE
jgi:hypothetical protein